MQISVALCTFNGARWLPEQLATICAQTRPPDEVVVRDDGSTDDTLAILDRFAAEAPFPVRVERNAENLGSTRNFDRAIAACTGDAIVLADQDDAWREDKLATIERAFDDPAVILAFSDADLIDDEGRSPGVRLWTSVGFAPSRVRAFGHDPFATLLRRPVVTGATAAFRAPLRSAFSPIPPGWVHDEWIALIAAALGEIRAIPEPLIRYRRHASNQVGVSGATAAERAGRALQRPREAFRARAEDFRLLRDRLAVLAPGRLPQVDAKIAHLEARAGLPLGRLARVPGVLGELVRGGYARYSGSTLAFVRDLLAGGGDSP